MDRASGFGPEGWGFDSLRAQIFAYHVYVIYKDFVIQGSRRVLLKPELLQVVKDPGFEGGVELMPKALRNDG